MKSHAFLAILLLIISLSINAEITTDGSLGSRANLPGPDYLIGADLGQQMEGNLFHSFQDFNLNSLESATFSGPNSVQNILSRVTGGNPSNIDGLIRSTIPNADMYFLNPYGIMFGENAKLDVQGNFHASTADYLRLGDGGRFDARNPNDSLLTVAPVEAFGFLTDTPAKITTQDSKLSISTGKTMSLIGGDLNLSGSTPPVMLNETGSVVIPSSSVMFANSGRINFASVASEGEVIPSSLGLNLGDTKGGLIRIDKSVVDVSGQGDGSIFIRGKNLLVTNSSQIQAKKQVLSENSPKLPNDNGSQKVSIDIEVETLSFNNQSYISGDSFTMENSGNIVIKANEISFQNGSWISNRVFSTGDSGDITLTADNILLEDGGIGTLTYHKGNAGDIHLRANEVVTITGADSKGGWQSGLVSLSSYDRTHENVISGSGAGGDIVLEAIELILTKGGQIKSGITVTGETQTQQAGNIDIRVSGSIRLSGVNPYGENENGLGSGITASSKGSNAGNAGTISLAANALSITDGATISASTSGRGQGGHINLNINGPISISGDSAHIKLKKPEYSQLVFQENFPHQKDRISMSGIYANSFSNINNAGNAGDINIQAHQIILGNNNGVATETTNATGGNINIETFRLIYLQGGVIETSVNGGIGDGGNITIENPIFVVLNNSEIHAHTEEGHGGNIQIKAEQFVSSINSSIDASSKLGIDGEVNIDSPTVDMNAFMVILPGGFVEAQLIQCTNEEIENPSTFKVDLTRDMRKELPFGKFLKLEPTRTGQ
ncbi:filamentous hemagglutinin N-terminal domain-containing protein [Candidatus Parabeggiatoa sp. HSG14]|uniref:two-partner secretion domain-containing protein n=1 Tax=Candidatus Parabeggiatoa sp. HSG14 TaxID=3055593 RepID=UPI0025A6EC16|nr:filamentous hemagglutinin N-terminal domain-containing protein [Thiotrichales bacterium HSG14]